jgi:hypothetical protein
MTERAIQSPHAVSHQRLSPVPSVLRCGVSLFGIKLCLATLGFRRTYLVIDKIVRRTPRCSNPDTDVINTIARHVITAAALQPGRAQCLEQSLALYYCLRRAGIAAEFRMGAKLNPFSGHAWVEYDGAPILEDPEHFAGFVPFPTLRS